MGRLIGGIVARIIVVDCAMVLERSEWVGLFYRNAVKAQENFLVNRSVHWGAPRTGR